MGLLRTGVPTVGAIPVSMMGGGAATLGVATYIDKVNSYGPIAYWPQNEAAGLVAIDQVNSPAQDGAYTGVTLGQPGIGDGETSPLFDGVNDVNDVYSVALNGVFDGSEGTIHLWFKVSAVGVWTDGTSDYTTQIRVNINNNIRMYKTPVNNQFEWRYRAAAVQTIQKNGVADVGWVPVAITWSATADQVKAYWNGAQEGAVQNGLGVWAGALDILRCCVGASNNTPANPWNGWIAHPAIWDVPLGAPAIADLAIVP